MRHLSDNYFRVYVDEFFQALREHTLLIIIDSASKNGKAVFSLVSYVVEQTPGCVGNKYIYYSEMLQELGFKNYGKHENLFVNYCAGRYSLYILDDIGHALRGKGIELPKDYFQLIQYQSVI